MKQSSCLRTNYQTHREVQLSSTRHQSRVWSQDLTKRLPECCISEIFRHLDNPEDRQSCASVCWRWAYILVSTQPNFWHPFAVHQADHPCLSFSDVDDAKLAAAVVAINRKEVVTELELSCSPHLAVAAGVPQLTDSGIHFVTSVCRNLKSLRLINCWSLTNKAGFIIGSNCHGLENLLIFRCSITDNVLSQVAKQCRKLKSLHIEGNPYMTEASLRGLVQYAWRLESITLENCPKIGEDAIMSFLMEHPYLGKFELKGMVDAQSHSDGVRQSSLLQRNACSFRQLHSLILVDCPGLQDRSMLKFSGIHFRMLRHLVIDDCSGVTHHGLMCMCLVGHITNPVKLKTIKLARFYFSKNAELMELLSLFSDTIESIILESCYFGQVMPLYSCEPLVWKCPKLKIIKLVDCESIMGFFLSWVSMACLGLKEVRLIGFPIDARGHIIFDTFMGILPRNGITKIELGGPCSVSDKDICTIARSCMGALQELILDQCIYISNGFALDLRTHCPNLIKLGFSRTLVKEAEIRILVGAGFEHLEELNLMGCQHITDSTLHTLAAAFLPKLKTVNVEGCRRVTREAVEYHQRFWEIKF